MKKRYAVLSLLMSAALVAPTLVGAQSGDTLPGQGWWTGQQIQNVGTGSATIVSTAYDSTNPALTYQAQAGPITAGSATTFLPAQFVNMPTGFQGSAVVSSDQPIKAIVTLTNRNVPPYGVSGGKAGGQYQGIDGASASTSISFPIVKNAFGGGTNIKTTTLFVQNAGSAATTVSISYACNTGAFSATSASIQPGQMVVLNGSAAGVPTSSNCSATATGTQAIAGVATEHYNSETVATLVQATRSFTSADADSVIYAPIFKNTFPGGTSNPQSRTTGAQVQNVGSAAVTVTATINGVGGTCNGQSFTVTSPSIAAGASYTFLYPTGVPAGCLASAMFDAGTGASIVGIVNESFLNPAPAAGTQSSTAYNMLPASSATNTLVAPLYKESFGGKTSGFQIQNISTNSATITISFKVGANTYTTIAQTVAAGLSYNVYQISTCGAACWGANPALPAGSNASVTVTSDRPVLGVMAEQTFPLCFGGTTCYDRLNYEGFNLP